MAVLITALMFSLTACRKDAEEVIAVDVDAEIAEESSEEIPTEAETVVPYVEENGLTFTDETKVQTQGILSMPDNTDTDIIDVEWELSNISISDTEDGTKTITIEQITYGYIWSDGDIFKTNLNLPSALLCDINNGKLIPMTTESTTTEIEWEEEKYSIETIEEVSWEDESSSDWVDDPNGNGERLSSNLIVTDTIKVTKDYDGLALILLPITSADSSIVGNYIMDVWSDGSYLFSISDLSAKFEQIKDREIAESEEGEEEIKQEETKSAHTHNYTSVVSVQPNCVTNGVKTYTCSGCGDSYTENLGYGDHNYVATTSTIHHDEIWQTVPKTVTVKILHCACGFTATNNDDWHNHRLASVEAGNLECGGRYWIEESQETVYDNVKQSDAWDEVVTSYVCTVCGATK